MIDEKDIKLLWGRAGGRCSLCNLDLTIELESKCIIIGEMAHIIAKKRNGPRGSEDIPQDRLNTYSNLILLCNNHHEMIDKSPEDFSVKQILEWKDTHEKEIQRRLGGEVFSAKIDLMQSLNFLLEENESVYLQYGPESLVARRNPISNAKEIWDMLKTSKIIPNNTKILNIIKDNMKFLSKEEKTLYVKFERHALSFEKNAYEKIDNECVYIFPTEFKDWIVRSIL